MPVRLGRNHRQLGHCLGTGQAACIYGRGWLVDGWLPKEPGQGDSATPSADLVFPAGIEDGRKGCVLKSHWGRRGRTEPS